MSRSWYDRSSADYVWRPITLQRILFLRRLENLICSSVFSHGYTGANYFSQYQVESFVQSLEILKSSLPPAVYDVQAFYGHCDSSVLTGWKRFLAIVSSSSISSPSTSLMSSRRDVPPPGKVVLFLFALWKHFCLEVSSDLGVLEVLGDYIRFYETVERKGLSLSPALGFLVKIKTQSPTQRQSSISCSHGAWDYLAGSVGLSGGLLVNFWRRYEGW